MSKIKDFTSCRVKLKGVIAQGVTTLPPRLTSHNILKGHMFATLMHSMTKIYSWPVHLASIEKGYKVIGLDWSKAT